MIKYAYMTIEFQTPAGKVPEKILSELRSEIQDLSLANKNISKAEVLLKEDQALIRAENKICEIRLSVNGGFVTAQVLTENFRHAAKEAFRELKRLVKQYEKKQKMAPL